MFEYAKELQEAVREERIAHKTRERFEREAFKYIVDEIRGDNYHTARELSDMTGLSVESIAGSLSRVARGYTSKKMDKAVKRGEYVQCRNRVVKKRYVLFDMETGQPNYDDTILVTRKYHEYGIDTRG